MRAALWALGLLLLASAAHAQTPELDRAEQLLAAGDYGAARVAVEQWWREVEPRSPAARPRALLLRARLAPDAAAAEQDYLAIVLGHPTAPEAAEALLRLGQALLAAGDSRRAVGYLERFAVDHPTNGDRATGLLWLARGRRALGQESTACVALADALALPGSPDDLAGMLRAEQATCARRDRMPASGPANPAADARPAPSPDARSATPADPRATPGPGTFAVQAGAFRRTASAETLRAQLRRAGFDARVVYVPGSALARVRLGRFSSEAEAEAHARRVHAAGFPAIVATDANRERPDR